MYIDFTESAKDILAGLGIGFLILAAAFALFMLFAMWKINKKAGQPGWAALIPIYNIYIELKIARMEWWYLIILIIPIAGFVVYVMLCINLAKAFGKGTGFSFGLFFLPFIFFPILAFGDAKYAYGPHY